MKSVVLGLIVALSSTLAFGQTTNWIPIPSDSPAYAQVTEALQMALNAVQFKDCQKVNEQIDAKAGEIDFAAVFGSRTYTKLYRSASETQPIIWIQYGGYYEGAVGLDAFVTTNASQTAIQRISAGTYTLEKVNQGTILNPNIVLAKTPGFNLSCNAK